MSFELNRLTAKIYLPGGSQLHAGTAWLCSPDYALTAAHCVVELKKHKTFLGPYRLVFTWGVLHSDEIAWLDPNIDVALLKITRGSAEAVRADLDGIRTVRRLPDLPPGEDRRWTSFGFPFASKTGGLVLDGEINEANAKPYGEVTGEFAVQLTCKQGGFTERYDASGRKVRETFDGARPKGIRPLDGASGSAVMRRNEIFGLIRSGPPMLEQRVIFATPLSIVAERSTLVAPILEQHRQNHIEEVRRRWLACEAKLRRDIIEKQLEWRPDDFSAPSPLERHWEEFVNGRPWHESMADHVAHIDDTSKEEQTLSWIPGEGAKLDFGQRYERLAAGLRAYAERCLSRLNGLIAAFEAEGRRPVRWTQDERERFENQIRACYEARRLLLELEQHLNPPLFRRCFLVMGSSGSGKTHFVASLHAAGDATENPRPFLVLLLDPSGDAGTLEELILSGIRKASGDGRWRSLEEFDAFVGERRGGARAGAEPDPLRLLVVIDGLEKWLIARGPQFDAELTEFISDHTHLHAVHWLITLHDASYDKVSPNAHWNRYSNVRTLPRVTLSETEYRLNAGGWYALDGFNRADELGLNIIRDVQGRAGEEGREFVVMLDELKRADTRGAAVRALSNPFIAWLLLDFLRNADVRWNVLELNIIPFIEKFWEKRLNNLRPALADAKLNAAGLDAHQLGSLVWAVARALCEFSDLTPARRDLHKLVKRWAEAKDMERSDEKSAESAVSILVEGNLLRQREGGGGNPFGPPPPVKIEILFETFWEYYIAKTLDPFKDAAEIWGALEQLAQREDVRESVCIFFMLIVAGASLQPGAEGEPYRQLFMDVARRGVEARNRLSAAVWFAGQKVDVVPQHALASLALGGRGDPLDSHALYALMAFLGDANAALFDVPTRLDLLRPHYEQIKSASLSEFYYFVARRLLRRVRGRRALFASMLALTGSEVTGCAPQLAQLAVRQLRDAAMDNKPQMLNFVVEYLQTLSSTESLSEPPHGSARPYAFYECVLSQFCHMLVFGEEFGGVSAYRLLESGQWYRPETLGIAEPIVTQMRQQANIELGRWFRTWIYEDSEYSRLVEELAGGDLRQRETAFYLIRHTISMRGPQLLPLGPKLRKTLRKLYRDDEMKEFVEKYRGLFALNLREAREAKGPAPKRRAAARKPAAKK